MALKLNVGFASCCRQFQFQCQPFWKDSIDGVSDGHPSKGV